ncbi:MAG: helix-turn-helix transcriptional regulator [Pseudomonadota bacterium]
MQPNSRMAVQEIIAGLYRAGACCLPWEDVLTACTDALDLRGSQLIGVRLSDGAIAFTHACDAVPSETELDYVRTYHQDDPRIPLLLSNPAGQWLYDQDQFDQRLVDTNSYYRDLLVPFGGRHTASIRLYQDSEIVVMMAFLSKASEAGFQDQQRQFLEAIAFHFQQAVAIYQHSRKLVESASAGAEFLRRLTRPAFVLDLDRHVSMRNEKAREFLQRSNALLLQRDRLTALRKELDDKLAVAMETIWREEASGKVPLRTIVRLDHPGQPVVLFSITPYQPSATMYVFGAKLQVLLMVHEPTAEPEADVQLWEAAFNLTPAQSRVALELYRGRTIEEAAAVLHVAVSTVKSHMKELYRKTSTEQRAQLLLALFKL